jgi:hypothetical protein
VRMRECYDIDRRRRVRHESTTVDIHGVKGQPFSRVSILWGKKFTKFFDYRD